MNSKDVNPSDLTPDEHELLAPFAPPIPLTHHTEADSIEALIIIRGHFRQTDLLAELAAELEHEEPPPCPLLQLPVQLLEIWRVLEDLATRASDGDDDGASIAPSFVLRDLAERGGEARGRPTV